MTTYTPPMPKTPKTAKDDDTPRPRKVVLMLTDAEWRQVRINAASADTSIQGWTTDVVLTELQRDN